MSVIKRRRVLLFLLVSMFVLSATVAAANECEVDGGGREGGFGCSGEPPNYDDKEKGDPDPRGRVISDEKLWDLHCDPKWDNEDPDDNNFHYHQHDIADFFAEYLNLDPTGEYIMVYAVCDGPVFRSIHGSSPPNWGYGPDGANFDRWVVAVTDPVDIEEIRDRAVPAIEGQVAAQDVVPGEMAPPADAGVVNTRTWLWVDNDFDQTIYDEESQGSVTVWVEAVPTYTVFDVNGEEIARCEGPGTPYTGGPLGANTDCFHEGFENASHNGPFDGSVTIEWIFHWGMDDEYFGEFHDYDVTTDLSWTIDEVFSTETG